MAADSPSGTTTGTDEESKGVLLLGATGRVGSRVLCQLLDRGVPVRAVVRSAARLPAATVGHPLLTVIEGEITALQAAVLAQQLAGCYAVISCLGHSASLSGVFAPPRDLVEGVVRATYEAIAALEPKTPLRLILLSSVSVNRPERAVSRRGPLERFFVAITRTLLPPARDNQRAADFLVHEVGQADEFVAWVAVRPDALVEGAATGYLVNEELVSSIFRPRTARLENVSRFMADLATDDDTWQRWRGHMPSLVDDPSESLGKSAEVV